VYIITIFTILCDYYSNSFLLHLSSHSVYAPQ
jgi:hypothetical protein